MLPILLIVDDEKSTRDVLSAALEDDYEVYAAANGKAARAILESEPVDIMLTDLRLGGESGMDLIDYAQTLPLPPACIMMTAYGSPATAAEAKRHGAYYFVTKPLNLDEVELLLKRAAHTRSLEAENRELTATLRPTGGLDALLGNSPQMQDIFNRIRRVAPTTATVLIQGETGTGKELVAKAIHSLSNRSEGKFVAVNCAALSPQLMESELFGHEKGAFTGALQRRIGRFEEANGGTLFLDEIGEMDMPTQVKLLRVLAEKSIERVGSNDSIAVNVRVLAATNRNLEEMVQAGTFRLDLYQRLNVISLHLPPLRERADDIVLMANAFVREFCKENGKTPKTLTRDSLDLLRAYSWPGNVRQLRTAMEHGVVMSADTMVAPRDLPEYLLREPDSRLVSSTQQNTIHTDFRLDFEGALNLEYIVQSAILRALEYTKGNRSQAAALLGINRRTLQRKMAESPDVFKAFL